MYAEYDAEVPRDEATVRRVQRAADRLQNRVLAWAFRVVAILPQSLPLTGEETELLRLFLAQQRRRNLELDGRNGHPRPLEPLLRALPLLRREDEEVQRAAQKLVSSYLEHAIEDTAERFCGQHRLSSTTGIALDWRVALRYMAQQIHRLSTSINLSENAHLNPTRRLQLAHLAHELAVEVVQRRNLLLADAETAIPS